MSLQYKELLSKTNLSKKKTIKNESSKITINNYSYDFK